MWQTKLHVDEDVSVSGECRIGSPLINIVKYQIPSLVINCLIGSIIHKRTMFFLIPIGHLKKNVEFLEIVITNLLTSSTLGIISARLNTCTVERVVSGAKVSLSLTNRYDEVDIYCKLLP